MKSFIQQYKQRMRTYRSYNFFKRNGIFQINNIYTLVIAILFSSCVTQRDLEYLRDRNNETTTFFREAEIPDYKLQINDELNIDIKSLDDPSTNVFQQISPQISGYTTPFSASLSSYMVDKSGYIQLPVLGSIHVESKTIPEVITMLQDSLDQILSFPQVKVKLVNRFVSVLGEVKNPGHYSYSQEKLTIFDALSLAGDITIYGNRNDVILARNENGKNLRINIDLTSATIMSNEYYYIRPNDIIYVKPMSKRFWGLSQFPWQILLSSISTAVLLYTVFGK